MNEHEKRVLSSEVTLMLAVLDHPNEDPGSDGYFWMRNIGSEPRVGSIYIDSDPGALSKVVEFVYQQIEPARLTRGTPPHASYEALFEAIKVPVPRAFLQVIDKMNEGQFLKLGPNDKGICAVPRSRRADVLRYLGFEVGE